MHDVPSQPHSNQIHGGPGPLRLPRMKTPPLNASPSCPTGSHAEGFSGHYWQIVQNDSAGALCHRSRVADVVTDRDRLESETRTKGRTGLRTAPTDRNVGIP